MRKKTRQTPEQAEALALWEAAGERYVTARMAFDRVTDSALTDAAIYELCASEALMRSALRRARELDLALPLEKEVRLLLTPGSRVMKQA